jgi:hypothetical protein
MQISGFPGMNPLPRSVKFGMHQVCGQAGQETAQKIFGVRTKVMDLLLDKGVDFHMTSTDLTSKRVVFQVADKENRDMALEVLEAGADRKEDCVSGMGWKRYYFNEGTMSVEVGVSGGDSPKN